jgi:hypothetical protein
MRLNKFFFQKIFLASLFLPAQFPAARLHPVNEGRQGPGKGAGLRAFRQGRPQVAPFHDPQIKGQAAQKGDSHGSRGLLAASLTEQANLAAAVGTDETAHVFHYPQDFQVHVAARSEKQKPLGIFP